MRSRSLTLVPTLGSEQTGPDSISLRCCNTISAAPLFILPLLRFSLYTSFSTSLYFLDPISSILPFDQVHSFGLGLFDRFFSSLFVHFLLSSFCNLLASICVPQLSSQQHWRVWPQHGLSSLAQRVLSRGVGAYIPQALDYPTAQDQHRSITTVQADSFLPVAVPHHTRRSTTALVYTHIPRVEQLAPARRDQQVLAMAVDMGAVIRRLHRRPSQLPATCPRPLLRLSRLQILSLPQLVSLTNQTAFCPHS